MAVTPRLVETDEIISLIYQGPLEERPWASFLRCLRERMDCEVAALSLRVRKGGSSQLNVFSRRDSASDAELSVRYKTLDGQRDPLGDKLRAPGDIYTLDEVISEAELVKTRYYACVMQPYGLVHQMGMRISEPGGWKSNVGVMSGRARGNFGAAEKGCFLSLRPHLERSLALYARIRRSESEKCIFEETLDRLSIGAFILDGNGLVIEMNGAARGIIEHSSEISLCAGKLALRRREQHDHLSHAIKNALGCAEGGRGGGLIDVLRVARAQGEALSILVRTVDAADGYRSDVSPAVIVYVCDSSRQQLLPDRCVAQLFGLSPTEAELATLLANGLTLARAAQKLSVTESTARTYCKRMFEKAGVNRQTDLVRMMLTGVAPLA